MSHTLVIDLHTYWQSGTGRGDGALVDTTTLRSAEGLPVLPGRTVKGLLRDAATIGVSAGVLPRGRVEDWFGSEPPATGSADDRAPGLERARYASRPGRLRVASAEVGEPEQQDAWRRWAASHEADRDLLFDRIASTALDANGVAVDATLRVYEVAIPMRLTASIGGLTDDDAKALREVLPFLRGLGSHRNRGLGRVTVRLEDR